jgi:hypothetical protein
MANEYEEKAIQHIVAPVEMVGVGQMSVEPDPDSALNFRMWGGKDMSGEVTRFLAKDKPARVNKITVTGPEVSGKGVTILHADNSGNVYGDELSGADLPPHNQLGGLNDGEYKHLTTSQVAKLHDPVTLLDGSATALELVGQGLRLKTDSSLEVSGGVLTVKESGVDHNTLSNLTTGDPHTQYILEAEKAAVNGVATLGADGKIPDAQIPDVAITDVFQVASQSAMLALTAQVGDIAVRSDAVESGGQRTYALKQSPASSLSNWVEFLAPGGTGGGGTGGVILYNDGWINNTDDVGAANTLIFAKSATAGGNYTDVGATFLVEYTSSVMFDKVFGRS